MSSEITEAIARLKPGESAAMAALFEVSYAELKRLAHSRLYAANLKQSFATDSLLHESYFRLMKQSHLVMVDRKHFFAYASKVMRSIILDEVRATNAERRGSGQAALTLHTALADMVHGGDDITRIEEALQALQTIDLGLASLVEMKFFGGMTELEIAEALGVSERTVRREWQKARASLVVLLQE
jgi:RNA polymerase sigma factor (TIGR02999 family)